MAVGLAVPQGPLLHRGCPTPAPLELSRPTARSKEAALCCPAGCSLGPGTVQTDKGQTDRGAGTSPPTSPAPGRAAGSQPCPMARAPPPQLPSLWGRQPLRSPCLVPVALKEPWQRFLRCCWGRAPRAGLFLCLFLPSLGLWPRLRGRGSLWPQAGWGLKPAELLKAWTLSAVGLLRFSPACNLFELWQGSSSQMRIFFPPKEEKSTVSCGAAARGCPRLVWSSGAAFPSCPPCLLPGSAAGSLSRQLNQHQGRGRQVEGP